MRRLDADESAQQSSWLCDTWPPLYGATGCTGFDPAGSWLAAAWVLNAIYERDDLPSGLTHHQLHQQAIAAGLQESAVVGGVNLDETTVTTGGGLGFAEKPPSPWRRVTWSELGRRDGFGFWAVDGEWPQPRFTPQTDWHDPAVMPANSLPLVRPTEESSWPVRIVPPTEGSLDAESLEGLVDVLSSHTTSEALADCSFYYGVVAFVGRESGATIDAGDLHQLPALVRAQPGTRFTPNNFWPADKSWLVYTDADLHATRVSGSPELIDALCAQRNLETLRCE